MKTRFTNGTRTPEVILSELQKTCRLVAIREDIAGFINHYYYNKDLSDLVIEVTINPLNDKAIATRQLSEDAARYIIPDLKTKEAPKQEIKFGGF